MIRVNKVFPARMASPVLTVLLVLLVLLVLMANPVLTVSPARMVLQATTGLPMLTVQSSLSTYGTLRPHIPASPLLLTTDMYILTA